MTRFRTLASFAISCFGIVLAIAWSTGIARGYDGQEGSLRSARESDALEQALSGSAEFGESRFSERHPGSDLGHRSQASAPLLTGDHASASFAKAEALFSASGPVIEEGSRQRARVLHLAIEGSSSASASDTQRPRPWRRSQGRRSAAQRFEVPAFEDLTLREARALARSRGIRLRAEDDEGALPRRGHAGLREYVLEQSVAAGAEVAGTTVIRLEVENTTWDALSGY